MHHEDLCKVFRFWLDAGQVASGMNMPASCVVSHYHLFSHLFGIWSNAKNRKLHWVGYHSSALISIWVRKMETVFRLGFIYFVLTKTQLNVLCANGLVDCDLGYTQLYPLNIKWPCAINKLNDCFWFIFECCTVICIKDFGLHEMFGV